MKHRVLTTVFLVLPPMMLGINAHIKKLCNAYRILIRYTPYLVHLNLGSCGSVPAVITATNAGSTVKHMKKNRSLGILWIMYAANMIQKNDSANDGS